VDALRNNVFKKELRVGELLNNKANPDFNKDTKAATTDASQRLS
jgi:hypothetical protein